MPTCCPLITHHRYNLDLIVRFSQRSRIARSFSPLQTKSPLFSRTYSLKSDPAQYGRVTAEKKGFQGQSGDCSSERDARLGSSIKNQPRGHYRRDERTRGGLTTGRRALPGSVLTRSSSSFFPLRSISGAGGGGAPGVGPPHGAGRGGPRGVGLPHSSGWGCPTARGGAPPGVTSASSGCPRRRPLRPGARTTEGTRGYASR